VRTRPGDRPRRSAWRASPAVLAHVDSPLLRGRAAGRRRLLALRHALGSRCRAVDGRRHGGRGLLLPWASAQNAVYLGVLGAIPVIACSCSATRWRYLLIAFGLLAFGSLIREAFGATRIERHRCSWCSSDVLLHAVLGLFRAGGQLDQQLHRPQRGPVFESRRITQRDAARRSFPRVRTAEDPETARLRS